MRAASAVLTLVLWVFGSALAHGSTLEVRPSEVTIHTEVGAQIQRSLLVRASADIDVVTVEPSELLADKSARALPLPSKRLEPGEGVETAGAGRYWSYPLNLDLGDLPAGEYSAALVFVASGSTVKVPIKVMVKHRMWWPALVILFGIVAGVGLSRYRAHGRPRDLLLTQLGKLRAVLQQDALLRQGIALDAIAGAEKGISAAVRNEKGISPSVGVFVDNPFATKAEALLLTAELCLQSEQLEAARSQLNQAEDLLRSWSQGRQEWAKQIAYLSRLQARLCRELSEESLFRQQLQRELFDLIDGAPQKKIPQGLRDAALPLFERFSAYQRIMARLAEIDTQAGQLGGAAWGSWQARTKALRRRAESIAEGQAAIDGLLSDIDKAQQELTSALQATAGDGPDTDEAPPLSNLRTAATESDRGAMGIEPVPASLLFGSDSETPGRAAWRLQIFLYATYGVMLVLLAGAGLNEVYGKRPTFGADLLGDYLTLLLWGFGAEATRDSIVAALRGGGGLDKPAADKPRPAEAPTG